MDINGTSYETLELPSSGSWGPPLDGRRTVIDPFVYPEDANRKLLVLTPQPADNVKKFYQPGIYFANQLSLTGNWKNHSVRLSFGSRKQKGIVPENTIDRNSVSLRARTTPFRFLELDLEGNYILMKGHNRPALGDNIDNPAFVLGTMARYVPMDWLRQYYEETGEPGQWPGIANNPYYITQELINNDSKERFLGRAMLKANIAPWLDAEASIGIDAYDQYAKNQWPHSALSILGGYPPVNGKVTDQENEIKDFNSSVQLLWNTSVANGMRLNGTLGVSNLEQNRSYKERTGNNLINRNIYAISNCENINENKYDDRFSMDFFNASAGMSYKDIFNFSLGGGLANMLQLTDQSGSSYTAAANVVLTNLMPALKSGFITYWNLRGSWAETSNYYPDMIYDATYLHSVKFNEKLKSGRMNMWETGVDVGIFNNALLAGFTFYQSLVTDQMMPVGMGSATGNDIKMINSGTVENKGVELQVKMDIVKDQDVLNWTVELQFSRNYSKIGEINSYFEQLNSTYEKRYVNNIYQVKGQPYGIIYGRANRRAPDGQLIVKRSGAYDYDQIPSEIGNICPKWMGGFSNSFSCGNFEASLLIDFVQGFQVSSETNYHLNVFGTGEWTNEGKRLKDMTDYGYQLALTGILPGVIEIPDGIGGYTYEKNTTEVDGYTYWATRKGEEYVVDGSFVRLQEVVLSYDISSRIFRNKTGSFFRISLFGRNLLYFENHMKKFGLSSESAPSTASFEQGVEVLALPMTHSYGISMTVSL